MELNIVAAILVILGVLLLWLTKPTLNPKVVSKKKVEKLNLELDYSNGVDVSYRLAELLPIDPAIKQSLLELGDTRARLSNLSDLVKEFQK